jgi:hypothetical protein
MTPLQRGVGLVRVAQYCTTAIDVGFAPIDVVVAR